MNREGRIYLALGGLGALGLATAVFLARRDRKAYRGIWASDTSKLASVRPDEVTVIWKLPPGPTPEGDVRRAYRSMCGTGGGPKKWMRPMVPKGQEPADPWNKPENQPLSWWTTGGTCPGCSRICGVSCYAAKAQNYYDWQARRVPWANLCDMMQGKGLPKIVERELPRASDRVEVPRGARWSERGPSARKISGPSDYWSNELVVDPQRIRRIYVRVHETGDFFDPEYARLWLRYAQDYVKRYGREMRKYESGKRSAPPPRLYLWAYTRSWRDKRFRKVLGEFSKIRYPEERVDGRRLRAQDAFSILLSADADTGVPWAKDARGRIMPVAYLLTKHDWAAAAALNNRVPGIVFQDYDLRKGVVPEGTKFGTRICRAEFMTPEQEAEIERLEAEAGRSLTADELKKKGLRKIGCGTCHLCQPNSIQAVADTAWRRFTNAARAGVDQPRVAESDLAMRADSTTAYESFAQDPKRNWEYAVRPVTEELLARLRTHRGQATRDRLSRLAQRVWSEKSAYMPVVRES